MITQDELANTLHALLTGFPGRAENLIQSSESLGDDERHALFDAVTQPPPGRTPMESLGDCLRVLETDRNLVNETYRASFYGSAAWLDLVSDPLFAFFSANKAGHVLDKWVHYFPIYTRHLAPYAGRPVSVLEIGVYRGGSMRMWARFFGPAVRLVGVDIDPVAVTAAGSAYEVVIADQADPEAMLRLAEEHGPFDVIIDDGGHGMEQQITSIETLFPLLADGGTYLVEDCHTSYWAEYDGGRGREGTFIEWAKERVDDLNGYHQRDAVEPVWTRHVDAIHYYDSVVVFDKKARFAPFCEQHGNADFVFGDRVHSLISSELVATRQAALEERDALRAGVTEQGDPAVLRAELDVALDELRSLRGELSIVVPKLSATHDELESTRNRLLESWEHVQEMRNTVSWRATAPMRRLRRR